MRYTPASVAPPRRETTTAPDSPADLITLANPRTPHRRSARRSSTQAPPTARCSAHGSLRPGVATATPGCGCRGWGSAGTGNGSEDAGSGGIEFSASSSRLVELCFEQIAKGLDQRLAATPPAHDHRERSLITEGRRQQHTQVTLVGPRLGVVFRQVTDVGAGQHQNQLRLHTLHGRGAVLEAVTGQFGLAPVAVDRPCVVG